MRIGIDMLYAQSPSVYDGIGNYSFAHIAHLSELPEVELVYFQPDYHKLSKEMFREELSRFIKDHRLDIFHFPSPMQVPYPEVILQNQLPPVRLTALVHDIIPMKFPEFYLSVNESATLYGLQLLMLKQLDHLFTNSDYTRQDLISIGLAPGRVTTVGVGGADYFPLPGADLQPFEGRFPTDRPFLLAFSPADFRKNAERLVEAFALAVKELHPDADMQLVFVNHTPEEKKAELDQLALAGGIAGRVHYAGRITKSELLRLYNRAHALAFPTLYEGVGLPALEAMQCGTPVLVSTSSSMPEIVGEAAVQVDPYDRISIARGLVKVMFNRRLRSRLHRRGPLRAERFQWQDVALRTAARCRKLTSAEPRSRAAVDLTFTDPMIVERVLDAARQRNLQLEEGLRPEASPPQALPVPSLDTAQLEELRSELRIGLKQLYQYVNKKLGKLAESKKKRQ